MFERALTVPEIETIMFPCNIVEQQGADLIARCAAAGKDFIAMKPLAGGADRGRRLAVRCVLANPAVTVCLPGMAAPEELAANLAAAADPSPLTEQELAACRKVRDTLGTQFCRRCNYCAPCTVGIQIPSAFLFDGYISRYGLEGWARERYATLPSRRAPASAAARARPAAPISCPSARCSKRSPPISANERKTFPACPPARGRRFFFALRLVFGGRVMYNLFCITLYFCKRFPPFWRQKRGPFPHAHRPEPALSR